MSVRLKASMKALPKRKGNPILAPITTNPNMASMKALPKRKGNKRHDSVDGLLLDGLNESPSEKEGKSTSRRMVTAC